MGYIVTEEREGKKNEVMSELQKIMAVALQLRLKTVRKDAGKIPERQAKWGELREYLDEYRDFRRL